MRTRKSQPARELRTLKKRPDQCIICLVTFICFYLFIELLRALITAYLLNQFSENRLYPPEKLAGWCSSSTRRQSVLLSFEQNIIFFTDRQPHPWFPCCENREGSFFPFQRHEMIGEATVFLRVDMIKETSSSKLWWNSNAYLSFLGIDWLFSLIWILFYVCILCIRL